jgi:hypothetical protein
MSIFDLDGKSLADPSSNGLASIHNGDFGFYGVIDQMLWRLPGDDPKKGVGAFARASWIPSDRNLIDLYAEAGVNFVGIWDKRPDDTFGLAASFSQLSPGLRELDRERAFFERTAVPLRNYELVVELNYQARIVPGWTVPPDFQYIFHPGGGVIAGRADAGKGRAARPRPAANLWRARLLPTPKARLPQDRTHRLLRTPPSEGQRSLGRKKDRRCIWRPRHARKLLPQALPRRPRSPAKGTGSCSAKALVSSWQSRRRCMRPRD